LLTENGKFLYKKCKQFWFVIKSENVKNIPVGAVEDMEGAYPEVLIVLSPTYFPMSFV
jgi:hypothetical protein